MRDGVRGLISVLRISEAKSRLFFWSKHSKNCPAKTSLALYPTVEVGMAGSKVGVLRTDVGDEDMGNSKRYGEIEEIVDDVERAFEKFENFGIVENPPSDQYFMSKKMSKLEGQGRRSGLEERIKGEWEVLKLCLTKTSIYVRAYEERPDLMRAIMVGPEGTPYHHALFCFDIRFPSNYPTQPPELFSPSYDHCFNPNSTTNGKLNLPALTRNEGLLNLKTKPSYSTPLTTLQVLTLIHNSFFTKKPDETLPRVAPSGDGHNIRVMKQTSEAMLCILKSPPQSFEIFVHGYFRTNAHQILMNFKFRIGLDETTIGLFYRLIRAFEANGTYCKHHYNKDSFDLALLQGMPHHLKSVNPSTSKKIPSLLQAMFSQV